MTRVLTHRSIAVICIATALSSGNAGAQSPGRVAVAAPGADATATRSTPRSADYRIGPDDVLKVVYWRNEDLSAEVVVRPDGYISLPLLRDVYAHGLTPEDLGDRIVALASVYLNEPNVTVVVTQINSRMAFITGEVVSPGPYPLGGATTVLQLIAMAGGLTAFADQDQIAIIRDGDAGPVTFRFSYEKASKLKNLHDNVVLLPGDTVLVP